MSVLLGITLTLSWLPFTVVTTNMGGRVES